MKLLLVTTSYPESNEGEAAAGFFVKDFADALHAENNEVEVVAPARNSLYTNESGVGVRRFAVPRLPLSLLRPSSPGHWPAVVRTLAGGYRAVEHSCAEQRPHHILALWALPSGAWAARAGRRLNIPYSTWALGSDIWSLGRIPVIRTILGSVLRGASHSFADGFALALDVERLSGRACGFLPSSRFFPCKARNRWRVQEPCRLAYLGRWHPNKGVDILLDSLNMLEKEAWSRIEGIRICGGGPLREAVHEAGARLAGMGRPVEIGGFLNRDQAVELFEWADYVLLPSRIESIPVVFSDAMAAGCPVVAMPVGDLPRLVQEHEVGILSESVTPQGFAVALERALAMSTDRFRGNIAHVARLFDVRSAAVQFMECLKKPSSGK
ncbi:Glycosyltransferase involved in cell wall bisynthesis [Desulfonatronum thiosulfatophilum]|uniref:Glycosyltransferase involved in cell wall bisynthesis n=1 Tax=Desulfonatronum thiosulfatophilum TaxID=617002 RepID=A0A1G6C083_9BACT|nr:glycosyltransferase [Desulfonatronum thiosulfatophilum]SDB26323.1 Glycosyltransferase involved in cell wall bisynthesis [Desulfonatronum thiosulfatophilum]